MSLFQIDLILNMPLVRKISRTIDDHGMLDEGSGILTGVSGGPDSVALFYALLAIGHERNYRIGVAHLNHGLRGEAADGDAAFAEALAKRVNVPYYTKGADLFKIREKTGTCLEEAGRDARYAFFHETANFYGFDKIAVGHHLDDDAELILMNIIRGSGPAGISGIPPVRGRVVRPLIHCNRKEILSFLSDLDVAYVCDESNDNIRFQRNHIRHCLIPDLEYYNPRIVENLHRMGQIAGCDNQWADSIVLPVFEAVVAERTPGRLALDVRKLVGNHIALKRRVLRKAIEAVKGDLRRIGMVHIDAMTALAEKPRASGELHMPGRIRVVRSGPLLIVRAEENDLRSFRKTGTDRKAGTGIGKNPGGPAGFDAGEFEYTINGSEAVSGRLDIPETGSTIVFERLGIEALGQIPSGNTVVFDWEKLIFPLYIRNMKPGDRFVPLGMSRTQKVNKYFINNKIPSDKRAAIPLVTSGSRIAWIAGLRMDDRFRITAKTRLVLRMKLNGLERY